MGQSAVQHGMQPTRAARGGNWSAFFAGVRVSQRLVLYSRGRLMHTLGELMGDPDPEKSKRVTDAMLKMQKIIVADLQKAYDG